MNNFKDYIGRDFLKLMPVRWYSVRHEGKELMSRHGIECNDCDTFKVAISYGDMLLIKYNKRELVNPSEIVFKVMRASEVVEQRLFKYLK